MSKKKAVPEEYLLWYPLDGTFHPSVARRLSTLHRLNPSTIREALCNSVTVLYLHGYTEAQAKTDRRTLCKKCVRLG